MNKLILVSCDNKDVYNKFVDIIGSKLGNIVSIDYENLITSRVDKLFNNVGLLYKNHHKLIDSVTKAVDKHGPKTSYDWLIDNIDGRNYEQTKMFVRVNDIKILNKLKRRYKRPVYTTLRITNTKTNITKKYLNSFNDYKWDNKIQFIDNVYLHKQTIVFMKHNIPSILFID